MAGPDLTSLALDAVQLAHETSAPHQNHPSPDGGGVNVILVVVGAVVTLALVGALIWLKERMRKMEEEERVEQEAGAEGV